MAELRQCPSCAEEIQPEAVKCRHCGALTLSDEWASFVGRYNAASEAARKELWESLDEAQKAVASRAMDAYNSQAAAGRSGSGLSAGGCAMQAFGILALLGGLLGIATIILPLVLWPVGIALLIAGTRSGYWHECAACGTRVGKGAQSCAGCQRKLTW